MLPRLTTELRDEIKAAIAAKVLTDGKEILKKIESLPDWITQQSLRMNKWEKELVHTASQNIYSNLACDISEKFDEIVDIFNGLSTEQYFKAQTEMLEKDFHRELLEVEKIYRKNLEKPASDWTSATYPYLAKFIYSYRHLAWQIYCVSTDLYQC